MLSSQKRKVSSLGNPTVIIEYMAVWKFNNMPARLCGDISLLLNHSEAVLEEVSRLCNTTAVGVNMTSTYRTMTFWVKMTQNF